MPYLMPVTSVLAGWAWVFLKFVLMLLRIR